MPYCWSGAAGECPLLFLCSSSALGRMPDPIQNPIPRCCPVPAFSFRSAKWLSAASQSSPVGSKFEAFVCVPVNMQTGCTAALSFAFVASAEFHAVSKLAVPPSPKTSSESLPRSAHTRRQSPLRRAASQSTAWRRPSPTPSSLKPPAPSSAPGVPPPRNG
jgi:hypothetical protein